MILIQCDLCKKKFDDIGKLDELSYSISDEGKIQDHIIKKLEKVFKLKDVCNACAAKLNKAFDKIGELKAEEFADQIMKLLTIENLKI